MNQLLIATHNPGKLNDYRILLTNSGLALVSLTDLGITTEPEETGKTFLENAELKARFYFELSKIPTLAEDGGLEIDYLNGEPGVRSRRWPGYEATDEELIAFALQKMAGVPDEQRTCNMTAAAVYFDGKNMKTGQGFTKGILTQQADSKIEKGFPYRSIFWSTKFGKLAVHLSDKEKKQLHHRKEALQQLGLIK